MVTVSRADDIRPYSGDCRPQVLATPYRAKLRIILPNCEKPCRARRSSAAHAASGRRVADPYKNLCVGSYNAAICGFSASLIKAGNRGNCARHHTCSDLRADDIRPYNGDCCPQVLATPYRAKLRIILPNCEKPCRARREVLHARERTLCA